MAKKALITGITGQDGAYLAKLLLEKGYEIYGAYRRSSTRNIWRLTELGIADRVNLVCMELTDQSSIQNVLEQIRPDEIYNLAAQSFVQESFRHPIYTGELEGLSVTRILEAIRTVNPKIKFYQASTSEMFGKVRAVPQSEETPFCPRSPYGAAKLYGHWMTVNYRESYDIFACSGIMFNHESPLRGLEFVTRKITAGLAAIYLGKGGTLELGNLDAKRDWGFAGDYVDGMWRMLQQEKPDDYVLATGTATSVRSFVEMTAKTLGISLVWRGKETDEVGINEKTGKILIKISPDYYRSSEVNLLIGDSTKAKTNLGWHHSVSLEDVAKVMIEADIKRQS